MARFPLSGNVVTNSGELPAIREQLSSTSYVLDLQNSVDYTVYVNSQIASGIDITQPLDGYADHSLVANKDYMLEFDINNGYSLVFLYTATSAKRKNVINLINDLVATSQDGKVQIDYFNSILNGIIYDNAILNVDVGINTDSIATLTIIKIPLIIHE